MKIKWTTQASNSLENLIDYLEIHWSTREIKNFETKLAKAISIIADHPEVFPASKSFPRLRRALIDKNNYLIYSFDQINQQIIIVHFRGTKQKPL